MAAHERFGSDQETVVRFLKLFESSAEGGIPKGMHIHATWEEDAAIPCLKAPFVEFRKISPKEGVTMEAIHRALDKCVSYMNDPSSGAVGATYGHVIEEPEKFMLVAGWKSIEARNDGLGIVGEIGEMAEEEVVEVSLRQFDKAEGPIYVL